MLDQSGKNHQLVKGLAVTRREYSFRRITLDLAALSVLLWASIVGVASNTLQDQAPGKRPRPTFVDSVESTSLVEQFGFSINDFKIDQQGEKNNLNIKIRYRYRPNLSRDEYPDFTLIAKDVENLLGNYPDKKDYWELVNKRLTLMIIQKYPAIAEVTCQIDVSPTPSVKYPRTSIVTRRQPVRGRATK